MKLNPYLPRSFMSKWRDFRASLSRKLNRSDSSRAAARSPLKALHWRVFRALRTHWGAQTFEFEKAADEISATGGPRLLSPRPFGPEPKILPLFPFVSVSFRNLPGISLFFLFLPPISLLFHLFPDGLKPDIRQISSFL